MAGLRSDCSTIRGMAPRVATTPKPSNPLYRLHSSFWKSRGAGNVSDFEDPYGIPRWCLQTKPVRSQSVIGT